MRKNLIIGAVLFMVFAISSGSNAQTQWNFGISGGSEGINGFHVSIGNYYHVPERQVVVIHERGIPDEELPVVLFLSRHAMVSPDVVIGLRARGWSWYDITLHLGLTPQIYYVPIVVHRDGPPYGHAYGHYKKHPRERWAKVKFSDAEIVNQVNLDFISKRYGYDPARVMRMREMGTSFVNIERKVYREKGAREGSPGGERGPARISEVKPSQVRGGKDRDWKEDRKNDHRDDRGEDRTPPGHKKR